MDDNRTIFPEPPLGFHYDEYKQRAVDLLMLDRARAKLAERARRFEAQRRLRLNKEENNGKD